MAVNTPDTQAGSQAGTARQVLVGGNVIIMTALAVAVVVVVQFMAYKATVRMDMTQSGLNSLGEGTENLLRHLDGKVRLTSLYFETDQEDEDQPKYRRAVSQLLDLYESTNRSKIAADWVNPLDHDSRAYKDLIKSLYEFEGFKSEVDPYVERLEAYRSDLYPRMQGLVRAELDALGAFSGLLTDQNVSTVTAPIEQLLGEWTKELERSNQSVEGLALGESPQFATIAQELSTLYARFVAALKNVDAFGKQEAARGTDLPDDVLSFLRGAGARYADMAATLEGEVTKLDELEPLTVDEILRDLGPTANAILVRSEQDVRVVPFSDVWPQVEQGAARFENRSFNGEAKLTSAILRATHKEQTAVVLVRFGGPPLTIGGFMPGQPKPDMAQMKEHLEDANFIVEEWDLKTTTEPPVIEPAPTRTIFVVLKPSPPATDQFGRPNPEDVPFGEKHRKALIDAMGENGRAMFIAGFAPGGNPMMPMPSSYEYGDYLKSAWGIDVQTDQLLIDVTNVGPGEYQIMRRDFYVMRDFGYEDHLITDTVRKRQLALPICSPLKLAETLPEGVKVERLVQTPKRDGLWAVADISTYIEQANRREPFARAEGDQEEAFDVAMALVHGDSKIVVVGSLEFAFDGVAMAMGLVSTGQSLAIRPINPGNITLFVNALHWLDDNTEFMNVGEKIAAGTLEIESASARTVVKALTIIVLPAVVLVLGVIVWSVRRR